MFGTAQKMHAQKYFIHIQTLCARFFLDGAQFALLRSDVVGIQSVNYSNRLKLIVWCRYSITMVSKFQPYLFRRN